MPLLLSPVVVEGIKVLIITTASLAAVQAASNIQQLVQDSDSQIYYTPVDDDLFADTNVERFPAGEGDASTNTPPFDLGELGNAREIDPEKFPSGNKFLEDLLNGQFEFPADDGGGGAYFLPIETNETLKDLRESSTFNGQTSSGMREYVDIPGGFEEANEIFDSLDLRNVKPLTNSQFEGRVGTLNDGRRVIVRSGSRKGPPTIEIQVL